MKEFAGEKTEQPTLRKLEEAVRKGQFPRSAEVQTIFVLMASMLALLFCGGETWRQLVLTFSGTLGHLHEYSLTSSAMQGFCIDGSLVLARCVAPVLIAAMLGGLLAGGIQSRFQTSTEALTANWGKLNPIAGLKRIFSMRSAAPTGVALLKLAAIILLTFSKVVSVLNDPIFHTAISAHRAAAFLAETAFSIVLRVCLALAVIAALDYTYQFWRNHRDLMMSREEVKDESKNTEGDPHVKSRQRRLRQRLTQRKMFLDVPQADVIVTNPTHIAIALRYDRRTMKAPRIVAKGSRLNALRIREIARKHQVPILENKPLARLMFKHGRVGGEIPAQLYAAVAEILAWVYRVNRYRYYTENNQLNA
ncbi:MAG: flagellar biosynthesis protein FlhB [Verrucomicrobiota bacterium]|jgi:flagellar biosynthetic protein FlhB